MNRLVICSVEEGEKIMNVRQEFFVTVQCALAYNFRIGSLFLRNIIGTIGRPAVSDGHTRKRRTNRLCHFSKQNVKVPVLEILRYKTRKVIDKKNLRLIVLGVVML
jgi:hypothetical protein